MKNIATLVTLLMLILIGSASTHAVSYDRYFQAMNVEVVDSPHVYIEYPDWARPNPGQNITDVDYWVNHVLPHEESRGHDTFLVYPKHGIVTPVLVPNETDQKLISNAKNFNHYKYLEQGALHYFGSRPNEDRVGNMVIAAHTSDKLGNPGKYKTIFQMLTISVAGDRIFLYIKNES